MLTTGLEGRKTGGGEGRPVGKHRREEPKASGERGKEDGQEEFPGSS